MVEDIDRRRDQTQREIRAARDARRDALEEAARIVAPRGPEPDPKIDDINSWEKWRERERLSNIIRARIDNV